MPYNSRADVVRLLAEWYDSKSNIKLGRFRSQLQAAYMSSHTAESWYNETVCRWQYIYIYTYMHFYLWMYLWEYLHVNLYLHTYIEYTCIFLCICVWLLHLPLIRTFECFVLLELWMNPGLPLIVEHANHYANGLYIYKCVNVYKHIVCMCAYIYICVYVYLNTYI